MRSKAELDEIMDRMGFVPDLVIGGYRQGETWISTSQARGALAAAEGGESWTEDDVEPLNETLARTLTEAGIE